MSENLLDELLAPALSELDPTTQKAVIEELEGPPPKEELLAEMLRFIDPTNVNSLVGYRLTQHVYKQKPYVSWDLLLGSCDRHIQWHGDATDLAKIDAAIVVLESLRDAVKAQQ